MKKSNLLVVIIITTVTIFFSIYPQLLSIGQTIKSTNTKIKNIDTLSIVDSIKKDIVYIDSVKTIVINNIKPLK